ncbi:MAG: hypothetical protein ACOC6P_02225 [Candidatus Aminicenantaceae bacterium]
MKNNNKIWIILSFLIVFIAGIAGGILIEECLLKEKKYMGPPRRSPPRFPTLEMMAEELELSPHQQEQLKEIFRKSEERLKLLKIETHKQFFALKAQLKKEMDEVFTEEQEVKLEAMVKKYKSEERRKRNINPKDQTYHHNTIKGDKK